MAHASEQALAPTAAFPALGDVFSTPGLFKIACHKAAIPANVELTLENGDLRHTCMRCRLRSDSTVLHVGSGAPCTFGIKAVSIKSSGADCSVTEFQGVHSCDSDIRAKRKEVARAYTEEKLRALRHPTRKHPIATPKTPQVASRNSNSRPAPVTPSSPAPVAPSDERRKTGSSQEKAKQASTSKGGTKWVGHGYPPARDLRSEIADLVQRNDTSLPSPTTSFVSPRQLLARVYAHGRASGFKVHRTYKLDTHDAFVMHCDSGKGVHAGGKGCGWGVRCEKGDDEMWRIVKRRLAHRHERTAVTKGVDEREVLELIDSSDNSEEEDEGDEEMEDVQDQEVAPPVAPPVAGPSLPHIDASAVSTPEAELAPAKRLRVSSSSAQPAIPPSAFFASPFASPLAPPALPSAAVSSTTPAAVTLSAPKFAATAFVPSLEAFLLRTLSLLLARAPAQSYPPPPHSETPFATLQRLLGRAPDLARKFAGLGVESVADVVALLLLKERSIRELVELAMLGGCEEAVDLGETVMAVKGGMGAV
ncbi:uncharacterized protein JCM10292_001196 [Rhodotorula paludigena]|uniref:uncharacterized protein n=1 Tax=Rhodotorula paludigena TaxID=86838 RepID=UPI00316E6A76